MGDLEILLAILLVVLFLTLLALWSVCAVGSILWYFERNKDKISVPRKLDNWKVFWLIIYGPFAYKILSKFQKESKNDN